MLNQAKTATSKIANHFQRGALFDEIGAAQASAGDLEAAVDSANRAYPDATSAHAAIEKALVDLNDLNRAKSLGSKIEDGRPSFFFSGVARTQAERGNITEALKIAEQIPALETRSYALEQIAVHQAARGDDAGARATLALARAANPKGLVNSDDLEIAGLAYQLSRGDERGFKAKFATWDNETKFSAMLGGAEQLRQQGDKARAQGWVLNAFHDLPSGPEYEFFRYFGIPVLVKVGEKARAMEIAGSFSGEMRLKGYAAVAVTCAEEKDVPCVDTAVESMKSVAQSDPKKELVSEFVLRMQILNVTAALIDQNEPEAALSLIATVEAGMDDVGFIKPRTQLQRVFILAQKGNFQDARALALSIRPDSITELDRGQAVRITALLQTKNQGAHSTKPWAMALTDEEDRAYALLGMAQALLGIDEARLGYVVIQVH